MFASKHEITEAPNQLENIVKANKKGSKRQNTNLGKVKIFKPPETSFSFIFGIYVVFFFLLKEENFSSSYVFFFKNRELF